MHELLNQIRACKLCIDFLPDGINPILSASPSSKIIIIGQAPGRKVHESGIPWDDKSGERLREWIGVSREAFYDSNSIALIPMGFCYPGKGKSGDLPPRKECAPAWHNQLLPEMKSVKLKILIGNYAQKYYLSKGLDLTLTERVKNYREYLSDGILVLPHPSPRNNIWLKKNPWFEATLIPEMQRKTRQLLN